MSTTSPEGGYDSAELFVEASDRFAKQMEKGKSLRVANGLVELLARELEKVSDGADRPNSVELPMGDILDVMEVSRIETALPIVHASAEQVLESARHEEGLGRAARDTAAFVFDQIPTDS